MENNTSNVVSDVSASEAAASEQESQPNSMEHNSSSDSGNQISQPVEKKLTKKLKLKIDQQEFDEELPFEIDENDNKQVEFLKRHLQMSKVAAKRMNEAAITRKQAEKFIEALQQDPMRVLSNPKLMGEEKFQKIAEEFLAKKIQEQMLSPEERNHIEMQEKLRRYEEQEKQAKEKEENDRIAKLQEHYQEQYTKTITQALESSQLPKNAFTIKRMAQLMQQNINHGLELEPQYIAQLVREDYQKEIQSLIGNSNPDQLISLFGEETINKVRKHDLEKLKTKVNPFGAKSNKVESSNNQNTEPKNMTRDEWREYIDKKARS